MKFVQPLILEHDLSDLVRVASPFLFPGSWFVTCGPCDVEFLKLLQTVHPAECILWLDGCCMFDMGGVMTPRVIKVKADLYSSPQRRRFLYS